MLFNTYHNSIYLDLEMIESRKIKQYARSEQLMKQALLSEIEDFNEIWNVKIAMLEKKFAQEKEYFEGESIFILLTTENTASYLVALLSSLFQLPTNCLSVFDHFMGLALKGLSTSTAENIITITVPDRPLTLTGSLSGIQIRMFI